MVRPCNGYLASLRGFYGAIGITAREAYWPASYLTQIFHDLEVDEAIEITEG